jgi:hypothetical protein
VYRAVESDKRCCHVLHCCIFQLTSLLIDLWDQIYTAGNRSSSSSSSANTSASLDAQLQQLQLRRLHSSKSVATIAKSDSPVVPTVVSTVVPTVQPATHSSNSSSSAGEVVHSGATAGDSTYATAGQAPAATTAATAGTAITSDAAAGATAVAGTAADAAAADTATAVKRPSAATNSLNSNAFSSRGGESVVWEDFTAFWVEAGMVCIYPIHTYTYPYKYTLVNPTYHVCKY